MTPDSVFQAYDGFYDALRAAREAMPPRKREAFETSLLLQLAARLPQPESLAQLVDAAARTASLCTERQDSPGLVRHRVGNVHHVAYRCRDAEQTVDFYTRVLGLEFAAAVMADTVPSIGARCPYLHIFFELGDGSYVAFFEVPEEPPMGRDPNTPEWVQHLALEVATPFALEDCASRLRAAGIDVVGPTDHGFIQSIYFFDPSGHRLELTTRTATADELARKRSEAPGLLAAWHATRSGVSNAPTVENQ